MRRHLLLLGLLLLTFVMPRPAWAQGDESPTEEVDPKVEQARKAFREGASLAEKMRWSEALSRFEASAKLLPHAGTAYNMGICERALGRYTRARRLFRRALDMHAQADEPQLPKSSIESIEAFLAEIEEVLATAEVALEPATASITIDGRPLQAATSTHGRPVLVAGTLPPGKGTVPPASRFDVVLDPGAHVIVLSRKGYADAVVRRDVPPGSRLKLELRLERLPAEVVIQASEDNAAISVDGIDVGIAPLTLMRPPGAYHIAVNKAGFDPYVTDVDLRSAARTNVMAQLQLEQIGIHERWWFWTSIAAVVATTVVVTYVATRPEPERPALNGGGLGWTIEVP